MYEPGTRVKVHSGDGQKFLGEGKYVGDVTVWFMRMPDGSLRSLKDAEKKPLRHETPPGAMLLESPDNPKIVLDSGDVVYGCQVWWEPA